MKQAEEQEEESDNETKAEGKDDLAVYDEETRDDDDEDESEEEVKEDSANGKEESDESDEEVEAEEEETEDDEKDTEEDEKAEGEEEEEDEESDSESEEEETEVKKKGSPKKQTEKKEEKEKPASEADNGLTVSVKGFPKGTDEEEIKNFIHKGASPDEIAHLFIGKDKKQRTRGFGFVILKTESAFAKMLALNETEVDGKTILVTKATFTPKDPNENAGKRKRGDDNDQDQSMMKKQRNSFEKSDEATLIVKNLDFKCTDDDIRGFFEEAVSESGIKQIRHPKNPEGGSRGFAFVEFTSQDALEQAKELNGTEFKGRKLFIANSERRDSGGRGNDFSKFRGDGNKFQQRNNNFRGGNRPQFNRNQNFNQNRNFGGRNQNFQQNKGKFGRESRGGHHNNKKRFD